MASAEHQTIFTIGHSDHSEEAFLRLLNLNGIEAIVDVRSMPYSKWTPQFNRDNLKSKLGENDIAYHFMGHRLGGRSDDPGDYDPDGRVQYEQLANTTKFQDALDSVVRGAMTHRIALMCSEGRPEECHRSLLIAEKIRNEYPSVTVKHLLPDRSSLTHEALRNRIAKRDDLMDQPDMFLTDNEKIAIAIGEQIERFAFKDKRYAIAQDVLMDDGEFEYAGDEH